mmetsp:Transcript_16888/g.24746  ORF Transcript_16888/g.24746 Transcript_16888/m.24746 type:complete len:737 (-) Transcript_16888:270-2480(-)|eukprot:CAMPEP_0195516448 /NCGR_PEP_ID=MMETSP0794_2-20130614/7172_1 /TAXON_ID=515487 /ORGANISM="Stephanopyxis turris, Strain CCMP 815" /LENGTH=736 /DNA_ID=CAMNT_0040645045 /DNA_START=157 /DNA_END=2367 /DNA_ORIENTATION=-
MSVPKSRISVAQEKFSAIPHGAKGAFYSAELLAAPCEKRAERGHGNHPDLKERLEFFTFLATQLRIETNPAANAEADDENPNMAFEGDFINSVQDIPDFIDVLDASLLHQKNSDFYTRSKTKPGFVPKKIVVVGGGPSGMFAATEALLHGHEVTVIEERPIGVRTRLLGLYPPDVLDLARLGGPLELFHNSFSFCDKHGGTIYDMERLLGAIALKMGATIYRNAVAQAPESEEDFENGILFAKFKPPSKVTKIPTTGGVPQTAIIKCNHHYQEHMPTEVIVHFDMILDCSGSGRPMTKFLVGKGDDSIDYLHVLAAEQLRDGSVDKDFYYEEDEHINDVLDAVDWDAFRNDMEKGLTDPSVIPQNRHVTCLIANLNRDVFRKDKDVIDIMSKCAPEWLAVPIPAHRPIDAKPVPSDQKQKLSARQKKQKEPEKKPITDRRVMLSCMGSIRQDFQLKHDAVEPRSLLSRRNLYKSMRTVMASQRSILGITMEDETTTWELFGLPGGDDEINRILFEGICPLRFTTGDGEAVLSREFFRKLNQHDSSLIAYAFLTASIDPSNIDNDGYTEYIKHEVSWGNPAQNATSAFVFEPKGVRCNEDFTFFGQVPGTKVDRPSYFVIGDACQDAWYRWGIGIKDAFNSVRCFSNCLGAMDANKDSSHIKACVDQLQLRMRKRAVQTSAYFWHYGLSLEKDPRMMKAYETMTKMVEMKEGEKVEQNDEVMIQAANILECLENYEE